MKICLTLIVALFTVLSYGQTFDAEKKSAEQGFAAAQCNLGVMYYKGEGTLIDKKKAAYWVKQSYENGSEIAKKVWDELELWKY